jgi:molybdate transport system ATP-binding protein
VGAGIVARFTLRRAEFALDVDLRLPDTGVTALFGPSGAGKTQYLRVLAGLERDAVGHVAFDGEVWQDGNRIVVPTHRRAIGYVFQEASLFPHLDVRGNLEYAARRSGAGDVGATADLLGIGALLKRPPQQLSGGERQRVAIARALLSRPRLLLFDEPMASLDLAGRAEILPYLERVRDEVRTPAIHVSHVPDEVARLADHLVLLDRGRVVAQGPLQQTLARLDLPPPFSDHAAVVIEAVCDLYDAGERLSRLIFAGNTLYVPHPVRPQRTTVRCRIEARDVSIALSQASDSSIINIIPAVIAGFSRLDASAQVMVRLDCAGTPLLARITQRSWDTLRLQPGMQVWAQIKGVALVGH